MGQVASSFESRNEAWDFMKGAGSLDIPPGCKPVRHISWCIRKPQHIKLKVIILHFQTWGLGSMTQAVHQQLAALLLPHCLRCCLIYIFLAEVSVLVYYNISSSDKVRVSLFCILFLFFTSIRHCITLT